MQASLLARAEHAWRTWRRSVTAGMATLLCVAICSCGHSTRNAQRQRDKAIPATGRHGAELGEEFSTKTTVRLGTGEPAFDYAADSAAIADATYPGLTKAGHPQAVVLVDIHDWATALAASTLAGWPLRAPLLYTHAGTLQAAEQALRTMEPTGAPDLGGARVISVRNATTPHGYSARSIAPQNTSASGAVAIERFASALRKRMPHRVIVTNADAEPSMTMPAAALAARTAMPVLFIDNSEIPASTAAELARLRRPFIYLLGPASVVSNQVERRLRRFGPIRRIAGKTPAINSVAVARFTSGAVPRSDEGSGDGFVFASAEQPYDAPPASVLSSDGHEGPLLVVEGTKRLPRAITSYLRALRHRSRGRGRALHARGWIIGNTKGISPTAQRQLDSLLQ
jgi:putative cell wall binding repeat protein